MGQAPSIFEDATLACFERVRPTTVSTTVPSNLGPKRNITRRPSVSVIDKPVELERRGSVLLHAKSEGVETPHLRRVSSASSMIGPPRFVPHAY